ncbi:MAG: uracil phosphoribosyltransferase [bacterium]
MPPAKAKQAVLAQIQHPLIQHKLTLLRDRETNAKEFRELVEELSALMTFEVFSDLPMREVEVQTPLALAAAKVVDIKRIAIIPILRAGLVMSSGILRLLPNARVGHIGLYRDPATLTPVRYYHKLPLNLPEMKALVVDPMLATGGSAVQAVSILKENGAREIKFLCIIAAPEGVQALSAAHPDVPIFTAALDERLNEHGYILPGLGDAGDRLFGTK